MRQAQSDVCCTVFSEQACITAQFTVTKLGGPGPSGDPFMMGVMSDRTGYASARDLKLVSNSLRCHHLVLNCSGPSGVQDVARDVELSAIF